MLNTQVNFSFLNIPLTFMIHDVFQKNVTSFGVKVFNTH
jgi:hypothetical protein